MNIGNRKNNTGMEDYNPHYQGRQYPQHGRGEYQHISTWVSRRRHQSTRCRGYTGHGGSWYHARSRGGRGHGHRSSMGNNHRHDCKGGRNGDMTYKTEGREYGTGWNEHKAEEKGSSNKQNSTGITNPGIPKKDNTMDTTLRKEKEHTPKMMKEKEETKEEKRRKNKIREVTTEDKESNEDETETLKEMLGVGDTRGECEGERGGMKNRKETTQRIFRTIMVLTTGEYNLLICRAHQRLEHRMEEWEE